MDQRHLSLALLGLALCVAGCGKSGTPPTKTSLQAQSAAGASSPATTPATAPSATEASAPTTEAESSGTPIEGPTGRIEGTVTFVGDEIPQPTIVNNTTDPQICGAAMSKRDVEVSPDTRGIRQVLVWLEGVKLPEGYKPPTLTLVLDNVKCQFEPPAAVITVGSTIETRNSDEVYHTTNLKGTKGVTTENIPLVSKGTSSKTIVRGAELIGVSCDKHGWMQALIRVDPHPFHAVTDADGKFSIADVPAGTYKLRFWHGRFYGQSMELTVTEDEVATVKASFPTEE